MHQSKVRKYIFISGGVISGLGKGVTTASISLLLKSAGFKVLPIKADMYLNIDAGTMNPLEHGEVFVTEDGVETDEDLGHYERFLGESLSKESYMTMGQVYKAVLDRERALDYGGKCVEGHIHIPKEIIRRIRSAARRGNADMALVEVGGTVGEYQNILFFEAIRRLKQKYPNDVVLVHVVYLPIPPFLGEMKSKPAQASIYDLYKLGLQPDFVVCRSEKNVDLKRKRTISFNTGVKEDHIITARDVDTVYEVPLVLKDQNLDRKIMEVLGLSPRKKNLKNWKDFIERVYSSKKEVKIAIAGKYFTSGSFSLEDSYVCVIEAIKHAAWYHHLKPVIQWIDVEEFEDERSKERIKGRLKNYDGIIVPQGWGSRGVEGKIEAVKFARKNKIPYLGLCFGMQMAVIEFSRNILGLKDANSTEVNPNTRYPVIHIMPGQQEYLKKKQYGGTIRLGAWPCKIKTGTLLYSSYIKYSKVEEKPLIVQERHRHRYEVNNAFRIRLEKNGMVISGTSPDNKLVEAIELSRSLHPFFVGTQFHPEYKSTPLHPHPIFLAFINACAK